MKKYAEPKEWMKPGAKVFYHSIINRPHDSVVREIESNPWKLGHGQYVVKVTGVSGGVAIEALKRSKEGQG
jgi:hypothetical protein